MKSGMPGGTTPGRGSSYQSHERHGLFAAVQTAIIQVDPRGAVVDANEQGKAYLKSDSIGTETPLGDALAGDVRTLDGSPVDEEECPFNTVVATGESIDSHRCRLYHPADGERVVECSGAPLRSDDGDIEGSVFSLRDVTEQVETERELDRYREFLTQSPDVTLIVDSDGTVQYQSASTEGATPFEYPDLEGKPVCEYVHPDDRERVCAAFEQVLADETESNVQAEYRIRQPSGSYRWLEARAVNYLGVEPIDGVLIVTRDIQDRKQSETRLGRYEQTVRQLQETTQKLLQTTEPDAAAIVALQGIESVFNFSTAGIWLANDAKTRLEPVSMSDHGKSLLDAQPTYTVDGDSLSWEAFASGTAKRIDDMMQHSGRQNPDTPIRSELIVPIGEFGIINVGSTELSAFSEEDLRSVQVWSNTVESALTRLDQIEALQGREAELTRERDRLDDFASIISHDLRNLLNVAGGHLGMAQSQEDLSRLEPVEDAIDRMDDIISDTLTLARQGEAVDDKEAVEITAIVEDCLDVVDSPAATFTVDEEFTLMADPDRLAHVFENLFRNSVDHGGPEVTVTVGKTDTGFYVADTGPGVPPEDRETVFESGYTTREGGTGLGLRIVEQVIEAHGWSITVTESDAGGARFEISGVDFVYE